MSVVAGWLVPCPAPTPSRSPRIEACLDEIDAVDPTYRTTAEKQEALLGLSRVIARAEAERLRVLAAADETA
jgi:hypothetical protein